MPISRRTRPTRATASTSIGHSFECSSCKNSFTTRAYNSLVDGTTVCRSCFYDEHTACDRCGDNAITDNTQEYEGDTYCPNCFEYITTQNVIRSYSYRPRPEFKRTKADKPEDPSFGIELEVERKDSPKNCRAMAAMIRGDAHYFKDDGSLNEGFEMVTHPMSELHIKKHRDYFASRLELLRSNGFRSNQSSTCGIHIHISKEAFTTPHLYKFMKFFFDHQTFMLLVSQRKQSQLNQWAKLGMRNVEQIRQMADEKYGHDRYTAINLCNSATVEVRIFKGTLNERSFFKNIEFTASLFTYTKETETSNVTLQGYFDFLLHNEERYPNLTSWLTEQEDKLLAACGIFYKEDAEKEKHLAEKEAKAAARKAKREGKGGVAAESSDSGAF